MKVICTNQNGWYLHEDKMCGFLEPREGIPGINYMEQGEVSASIIDRFGDLFYEIDGKWWEAEFFSIVDAMPEVEITYDFNINPQTIKVIHLGIEAN